MSCFECGSAGPIHEHHVVPKALGGKRKVDLCEECHGLVHESDLSISALTREAMRRKRARRERYSRYIPYGQRLDPDGTTLVDIPIEQTVMRAIRVMRDRLGMTWESIARELNQAGIPTKRRRGDWFPNTARRIYGLGME